MAAGKIALVWLYTLLFEALNRKDPVKFLTAKLLTRSA